MLGGGFQGGRREAGGQRQLMKRAEKRLPTCHPRSPGGKARPRPEEQHQCPICVCLPVDTGP